MAELSLPTNPRFQNLTSEEFHQLRVEAYAGYCGREKRHLWKCVCLCGKETTVSGHRLKSGNTKSCGCLRGKNSPPRTTHGHACHGSRGKEWQAWVSMRQRCRNPNDRSYHNYGGRGITVDPHWNEFENFLADMGKSPSNTSLDRLRVNDNYCKENCHWGTPKEQAQNRRSTVYITHGDDTLCVADWARLTGLAEQTIRYRHKKGLPPGLIFKGVSGTKNKLTRRERLARDAARKRIARAVKAGKLTKPKVCETVYCKNTEVEAHHFLGYALKHALKVRWLCKTCHGPMQFS